jgi:hypothetical protein
MTELLDWENDSTVGGDVDVGEKMAFINVLQALSPEVQDEVEGAKAGELINTGTGEIVPGKDGLLIQPLRVETWWVEWSSRESGGGMVGRHSPASPYVNDCKRAAGMTYGKIPVPGTDNTLRETKYLFAHLIEDGENAGLVVLAFHGSKMKKLRKFMTAWQGRRDVKQMFQCLVRVKTEKEKAELGTFYNFDLTVEDVLTKDANEAMIIEGYKEAKGLEENWNKAIEAENLLTSRPELKAIGSDKRGPAKELEDEIPF